MSITPLSSYNAAAYCKHCRLMFPGPVMKGYVQVTFDGSTINCPRCNRQSEILNATYTGMNDRMQMVLAPSVSEEARAALKSIVLDIQSKKISLEEAQHRAELVKPGYSKIFDIANWSDNAKATLFGGILGAGAALAVAAATVLAPFMAPTPNIVVQMLPPVGGLKTALMSGTSRSAISSQTRQLKSPIERKEESANRNTSTKPSSKNSTRQKRPH